jgi:hypothetical protein
MTDFSKRPASNSWLIVCGFCGLWFVVCGLLSVVCCLCFVLSGPYHFSWDGNFLVHETDGMAIFWFMKLMDWHFLVYETDGLAFFGL